jgi:putative selenate reductase
VWVRADGDGFASRTDGSLKVEEKHQIGNFADFCNECGNCDVFCPEDGGPYVIKPRFFGALSDWREFAHLDGFFIEQRAGDASDVVWGRFAGRDYSLERTAGQVRYTGDSFELRFDAADPLGTMSGTIDGSGDGNSDGNGDGDSDAEVDLSYFHLMTWIRDAVLADDAVNYISCLPVTA